MQIDPAVIVATMAVGAALIAAIGIVYLIGATCLIARLARPRPGQATDPAIPAITVMKPLHGREPQLVANLASFLQQAWPAPVQMLCGIADPADAAADAIADLRAACPDNDIELEINQARHGSNAKVSNLINMGNSIRHDIVVLSDSDIAAPEGYYRQIVDALSATGVGAVTCLYRGRGDVGFWSTLAAANISYQFLPNVVVSLALDAGGACMGSTIALRRDTLDRIGGFRRFADVLADDHALGVAVRDLGMTIAVPPMLVVHACAERSFAAVARQELRWAATIRDLRPMGYLGSAVTMPLPFALISIALAPSLSTLALVAAALLARVTVARQVDRFAKVQTAPYWWLPIRELMSFGLFVASFFIRAVDWRGQRLAMIDHGRVTTKSGVSA